MEEMLAAAWVRKANADKAFEIRSFPVPYPGDHEICIKIEAFGVNYADIMAYKGYYRDAPARPTILGYDVCGYVTAVGKKVTLHRTGDRVTALTRFGGYAEYAVTDERAAVSINKEMDVCTALSLATQGTTAWYCVEEATRIYEGERVIITAAAGGVGSLIVQLVNRRNAKIYGIVSTEEKGERIRELGAVGVLNRSKGDVFKQYRALAGEKAIDVMFDSAGGSYIRKGLRNLAPGGRMIAYGAAQGSNANNLLKLIPFALSFGFYHPAPLLMQSQSLTGVNMLRLADYKPDIIQKCMGNIVHEFQAGQIKVFPGKIFPAEELVQALHALEKGNIPGKIAVAW